MFVAVGKPKAQPTVKEWNNMCFGDFLLSLILIEDKFICSKNDDKTTYTRNKKYV